MNALKYMMGTRQAVLKKYPYASQYINNVRLVESFNVPTMSMSKDFILAFNPMLVEYVATNEGSANRPAYPGNAFITTMFAHEITHLVLQHYRRGAKVAKKYGDTFDYGLWNVACDIESNAILVDDGFLLMPEMLTAAKCEVAPGGTAESYYAELHRRYGGKKGQGKQESNDDMQESQGSGDGGGGGSNRGNIPAHNEKGEKQENPQDASQAEQASGSQENAKKDNASGGRRETRPQNAGVGKGDCGSAADNIERQWEKDVKAKAKGNSKAQDPSNNGQGGMDDSKTTDDQGSEDGPFNDHELDRMAEQAIDEAGKMAGSGAGNLARSIARYRGRTLTTQAYESRMRRVLGRLIARKSGMEDYSYYRPSRRHQHGDIIMPGMVKRKPLIAVVLDTSGSMDENALKRAAAEVQVIAHIGEVWMLPCDVVVHDEIFVMGETIAHTRLKGGGGTRMANGIYYAMHHMRGGKPPDVIIVLTDGATPWVTLNYEGVDARGNRFYYPSDTSYASTVLPIPVIVGLIGYTDEQVASRKAAGYKIPDWMEVVGVPNDR